MAHPPLIQRPSRSLRRQLLAELQGERGEISDGREKYMMVYSSVNVFSLRGIITNHHGGLTEFEFPGWEDPG